MDAQQNTLTSKGFKKRKRNKFSVKQEVTLEESSTLINSELPVQPEKEKIQISGSVSQQDAKSVHCCGKISPKNYLQHQIQPSKKQEGNNDVESTEAPPSQSPEPFLSEPDKSPSKRKRNRKRKKQVVPADAASELKTDDSAPNTAVVSLSQTLMPAVQEAIRLLQTNEAHVSNSNLIGACSASKTSKPSKKSKKKTDLEEAHAGEVEEIISPGAQRLASDQAITNACFEGRLKHTEANLNVYPGTSELYSFNSEDLEVLLSASNVGPIYSRSSLSSPVAVTSSSLSSQLSTERIQNSHLFGKIQQSATCKISSVTTESPGQEMNAPAIQKSREEVEAERKARKAAKQAAKNKDKANPQEVPVKKPDSSAGKEGPGQTQTDGTPISGTAQKVASLKSASQKESVEKLTKGVKSLNVSQITKEVPKSKAVDVPDFAHVAFAPTPYVDSETISRGIRKVPMNIESEKSKAELKAERRAKQEAQRAAKAQQQQQEKQKPQSNQQQKLAQSSDKPQLKDAKVKEQGKPLGTSKTVREDTKAERRVKLFSHLYQDSYKNISQSIGVNHPLYHLAIVRLGVQYANRVVLGSNARCLALLYALKELIADYVTPPQKEFSRGLEAFLQPNMDFLQKCRPHSVSMINALRHIKWQLTQLSIDTTDAEARQQLQDAIDTYINEQIEKAAEAIGGAVSDKIADDDVILVYACSSLVLSALKVALAQGRKFRVVVVDSLPWLEGREMLRRLVSIGVQCSYVHLSAASFVMRHVSKVLLGAHALLANGYVMSRAGSSQVALLAHTYNVPVLVCCETHKFSERVQTDSFVYNELGDPDELIGSRRAGEREAEPERPLANWRELPCLGLLNLVYDVTPPDLVTAVVTERAILPCTSVPVILRIKPPEC